MLEKVSLFEYRRDYIALVLLFLLLSSLSLAYEYYNYKELTKFDSQLVTATVLKQYTKSKLKKSGKRKTYQVLKLKSEDGFTFYTTASKNLENIKAREVQLEVWARKISFFEYMRSFYAFSKILQIYPDNDYKTKLNNAIAKQHEDEDISLIYQALYTAKQLPYHLQKKLSELGLSHLVAISGFHLGVLSTLLFFLLKYPYKFLQRHLFPYRSYKRDSFTIIAIVLLGYLLFLDQPPSLLRAYVMLVVGFILYERHVEILSMQTLSLTILLILALYPRLYFSVGFWLSVSGVFYIFLFLIHFQNLNRYEQFLLLPLWIYFFMLPYSLILFGNFSLYHPLSIVLSSLFTLFYPLSILLHTIGHGDLLDPLLLKLISLDTEGIKLTITKLWFIPIILFSLLSIFRKKVLILLTLTLFLLYFSLIYTIYNMT